MVVSKYIGGCRLLVVTKIVYGWVKKGKLTTFGG